MAAQTVSRSEEAGRGSSPPPSLRVSLVTARYTVRFYRMPDPISWATLIFAALAGEELAHLIASRIEELGAVREQLGVERGRRERLEEENERLRTELEAERSKGFWARLFGG